MPRSDACQRRDAMKEAKRLARTTECPSRAGLALIRLTRRARPKIHWDPLAYAVLAERAMLAPRQGEVGIRAGEAMEDIETRTPPDFAIGSRRGVCCGSGGDVRRVSRQGRRGRRRIRRSVVERHGDARRKLKQILKVLQLGLLMANAVLQCGHMMADGD